MPSSVIAHMQYSDETKTLRVVFVSGAVYDYKNVPAEVYRAMQSAPSKGAFLNTSIKEHYPFKKIK
jgi:hypothetical protein